VLLEYVIIFAGEKSGLGEENLGGDNERGEESDAMRSTLPLELEGGFCLTLKTGIF